MSNKLSVEQLMSKAVVDESSLPSSILNRQQADRFIDLVIDFSVLLKAIRNVRVDHPKGEINKLNLGSIVTEGASATTTPRLRVPSESTVEYDMIKYRSAFDLTTDFTEDNIQGNTIRDLLIEMFTKRIAVDLEITALEGDSSISTGDGETDENNLLGVNDGLIKLLVAGVPAGQQLDFAGAASSKKGFHALKRLIPSRFRVARPDYRWIVGASVWDKHELDTSNRATSNQGDAALVGQGNTAPFGVPLFEVPLMPEDLAIGTAVTDGTKIILSPLKNLIWYIQRDITIEWDRQPRSDSWEVTIHTRVDTQVEDANMVVLGNNVSEAGTDYA
jgi:HK97 family phage major capsid protein